MLEKIWREQIFLDYHFDLRRLQIEVKKVIRVKRLSPCERSECGGSKLIIIIIYSLGPIQLIFTCNGPMEYIDGSRAVVV